MTDNDIRKAIERRLDEADTLRRAVASVKEGGVSYNDVWAMVPVEKARKAGLL